MSSRALIPQLNFRNAVDLVDDYTNYVYILDCAEMTKHIRTRQAHTFLYQVTDHNN